MCDGRDNKAVHCTQEHIFIYTNIVCITIAYQQFVICFVIFTIQDYHPSKCKSITKKYLF